MARVRLAEPRRCSPGARSRRPAGVAHRPPTTQPTTSAGRVSPQLVLTTYPDDSLFQELSGPSSLDSAVDARFNLGVERDRWSLDVGYQLIGLFGDASTSPASSPRAAGFSCPICPDDGPGSSTSPTSSPTRASRRSSSASTGRCRLRRRARGGAVRSPGHHLGQRDDLHRHGHLQPLRPGRGGQGVQDRRRHALRSVPALER